MMSYRNGDPNRGDWPGSGDPPGRHVSTTFGNPAHPFTQHRWEQVVRGGAYVVVCEDFDGKVWYVGSYVSEAAFYDGDDPLDIQEFSSPDLAGEHARALGVR